ncbi:Putative L-lactate dehydrogenase [Pseudoclavibacter triregionum]|nr:Putative L-lactate dehydrogenase [Pseudoclavibacter triregionum]
MLRDRIDSFTSLLDVDLPKLPTTANRLAAAATVRDLHRLAKRRTPKFAFDYVEGGAGTEAAMRGNLAAFNRTRLQPRFLRGIGGTTLETELLGQRHSMPVGIAPIGLTGLMRADGELAGVRAVAAKDVPFALSTMGTRSIEAVAEAAPGARKWFQLYVRRGRELNTTLIERALANGYDTLVVTADTPVSGRRIRDEHNRLSMPPRLSVPTVVHSALHPAWTVDLLRHDAPTLANFDRSEGTVQELVASMFDPELTLEDLEWIREAWPGGFVVKGVLAPEDAVRLKDAGVDAVWISNHGGRQLDRSVAPIDALPAVRAAVGEELPLFLDSGVRTGTDVATAIALGADFVFLGRAYLYGLMAGGQAGVERALELIGIETRNAMQLLGVGSVAELREQGPELVVR